MSISKIRLRRLRQNPQLRSFLSETDLSAKHLVQPLFVKEGLTRSEEILSMPGQFKWTMTDVVEQAAQIESAGVAAIILFGIPKQKDLAGRQAYAGQGVVQNTIRRIKKRTKDLLVIADVCLCEYLSHGHCGHVKNGRILNDSSVKTLSRIALSYAEAGADVVAPSDMMDGRIKVIRSTLDKKGFHDLPIISYAAKYASAFYGPFRDAAESAPQFGDRRTYQMNPANRTEALREVSLDLNEGADMILVKPALAYLDVLSSIKNTFHCPTGAYSVSGEYSMIKAAAQKGWLDERKTALESHMGMRRAGADFIISYWAKEMAVWLKK